MDGDPEVEGSLWVVVGNSAKKRILRKKNDLSGYRTHDPPDRQSCTTSPTGESETAAQFNIPLSGKYSINLFHAIIQESAMSLDIWIAINIRCCYSSKTV
jgi:hypothetical protein